MSRWSAVTGRRREHGRDTSPRSCRWRASCSRRPGSDGRRSTASRSASARGRSPGCASAWRRLTRSAARPGQNSSACRPSRPSRPAPTSTGPVVAALDARRREVFAASWPASRRARAGDGPLSGPVAVLPDLLAQALGALRCAASSATAGRGTARRSSRRASPCWTTRTRGARVGVGRALRPGRPGRRRAGRGRPAGVRPRPRCRADRRAEPFVSAQHAIRIERLRYQDLPQVIAIERRAFPTPWSLAMFVLELSKPAGVVLRRAGAGTTSSGTASAAATTPSGTS